MWVSTVRVSTRLLYSHTSRSSCSRDCTRPRRWANTVSNLNSALTSGPVISRHVVQARYCRRRFPGARLALSAAIALAFFGLFGVLFEALLPENG